MNVDRGPASGCVNGFGKVIASPVSRSIGTVKNGGADREIGFFRSRLPSAGDPGEKDLAADVPAGNRLFLPVIAHAVFFAIVDGAHFTGSFLPLWYAGGVHETTRIEAADLTVANHPHFFDEEIP